MKMIEIDLETRSDRDITKCGVYAYVDSPYFAITLMSVSVDGGAVQLYDLANGDRVPDRILSALSDENVVKRAFNVNFERVCLSKYLLRKRYLEFLPWSEIMKEMGYSKSHVFRLHSTAVAALKSWDTVGLANTGNV